MPTLAKTSRHDSFLLWNILFKRFMLIFCQRMQFCTRSWSTIFGWKKCCPFWSNWLWKSKEKLIWDKDFQTSNKKFWWHSDFLTYFGSDHQNESEVNESCMLLLTHFCHCWSSFYKKVSGRQFPKYSDLISVSLSIDCNTTLL